jgi:hypothetical protein
MPPLVAKVRRAAGADLARDPAERTRQTARRGGRNPGAARPATTRQAARLRPVATPRDSRRPRGDPDRLVLIGTSTGGHPRSRPCSVRCLPIFRGRSSSRSTCPLASPGACAASRQAVRADRVRGHRCHPDPRRPCLYRSRRCRSVISRRGRRADRAAAPSSPEHHWHPSVERLVESAMLHVAARNLIGVLMTGMGADGATAMTALQGREATIAEAEESAVVWGMPGALVAAGGAGSGRSARADRGCARGACSPVNGVAVGEDLGRHHRTALPLDRHDLRREQALLYRAPPRRPAGKAAPPMSAYLAYCLGIDTAERGADQRLHHQRDLFLPRGPSARR